MKELEKEFIGGGEVAGVLFKQYKFSDYAYMYELTCPITNIVRYEVFKRIVQKEQDVIMFGASVHYEEKVAYPKSGLFGKNAWCFNDLQKALEKFDEINVKPNNKDIEEGLDKEVGELEEVEEKEVVVGLS